VAAQQKAIIACGKGVKRLTVVMGF